MTKRLVLFLAAMMLTVALAPAAEQLSVPRGTRRLSGWINATTPEGWTGRRYMEADEIFAEEFDSNGNGRIDVWRFYRSGILTSEERDLTGSGRINYQSRWDPAQRRLISVFRDTNRSGTNDLEIEYVARGRWEVREDRNNDGIADRILILNGRPDLFEQLGLDLSQDTNIIDSIPTQHWYELQSDDEFTGSITLYRRYSRGTVSRYGYWDGRKIVWERQPRAPVPPAPAYAPQPTAPAPAYDDGQAFDASQTQTTPSYAPEAQQPGMEVFDTPYGSGESSYTTDAGTFYAPDAGPRTPTDRTRYEGLPPGDSAARSLPARMRPPGANRR